jgi:hypothetical protein
MLMGFARIKCGSTHLTDNNSMAVYVDSAIWAWAGCKWCHLLGDDLDELHRFAALIGIKRASFQGPPRTATPHYDLTGFERTRAIRLGAIPCDREAIVLVSRRARARAESGG